MATDFTSLKNDLLLQVRPVFERLDKVASGKTVESFEVDIDRSANGFSINFTADDSAQHILEGRRPGSPRPPILPISQWLLSRGLDVIHSYAVAGKISRDGIEPVDWVTPLERELDPIIQSAFNSGTFDDEFLDRIFLEFGRTDS